MYKVDLQAPQDSWGLFVDLKRERGTYHDSQSVEEYRDGYVYGHVRRQHDHLGTPREFPDWLRERVTELIHELVRGHIDRTYDCLEKSDREDKAHMVAAMCRDIAALPRLPEVQPFGCQSLCDALTAILSAHEQGIMTQQAAVLVRTFLDEYSEPPFRQRLRDKTIQHAFALLPEDVPASILDDLEARAKAKLAKATSDGELTLQNAASVGRLLELQPAHLRPIYNGLVLPRCDTAELCFAMATALSASPVEAAEHAQRGLQLSPTHGGLRRVTEILGGGSSAFQDAADIAKHYEDLLPKVLYKRNSPDLKGNDQKLIDAEARLNRFWMSVLPPRADPSWEQAADTLCLQDKFKVRGSEAYLTWCRVQQRNDEGVDYFLRCVQDVELTQLQHRVSGHCETYLAQGFSCMLDTQRPEHIEQASEVITKLEAVLTWTTKHVYYALACIASRAGQLERALDYATRSVDLGHEAEVMLTDPDFANLMADPEAASVLRKLGD
ncbi:MAG: TPR end-of-group domain-containing protein [Myxococcota bacterium]